MKRVRLAAALALVAAAAAVVSGGAGPASAVSGLQSGYWWQAQPDGAPVPPPPQVPPNGLWVSGTPDAQVAIAAVRFELAGDEADPVLTMKIHSKNPPEQLTQAANAGVAVVLACPATKPWTPASAGAWSSRPDGRCDAAVNGTLNGDATAIAFDLGQVASNGAVDVVLVPGTGGAAALPSTPALPGAPPTPQPSGGFDITFDPVAPDQIVTSPAATEAPSAATAPEAAPAPTDVGSAAPTPAFNFATTEVNPAAGIAAAPAPSPANAAVAPQLRPVTAEGIRENHGYRALAALVLAALLWWAWRQAVPPRADRRTIYDGPPAPTSS